MVRPVQRFLALVVFLVILAGGGLSAGGARAQPLPASEPHVYLPVVMRGTVLAPPLLDQWTYYRTAQVLAVALDEANGVVWAGTDTGAVRWNRRTGARETFTTRDGLASDVVTDVAVAGDGGVWLAHDGPGVPLPGAGVSHRAPDGRWRTLTTVDGLPSDEVYAVERAPDGSIWFGTSAAAGRLSADGRWSQHRDPGAVGSSYGWHAFHDLAFDRAGNLWVATDLGVSRLATDGAWRRYTVGDGGSTAARAIAVDAAGNAWFSQGQGVTVLQPQADPEGAAGRFTFTTANGLHTDAIVAIAVDAADNRWFASQYGVSRLGPDGRTWSHYREWETDNALNITDVTLDRTGRPWVGTLGYLWWLGDDGRWQPLPTPVQLGSNRVTDLVMDTAGRAWAALNHSSEAAGGLAARAADGTWTFHDPVAAAHPGTGETCGRCQTYDVARAPDGSVWLATSAGAVRRWPNGTWTHYTRDSGLATSHVRAVEPDRAGGVWFANAEASGLFGAGVSYLAATGEWRHFSRADGLASDAVHAIAASPTGDVWFVTGNGITVRTPAGVWRTVRSVTATIRRVAFAPDGHAWLATNQGVVHLRPDGTLLASYTRAQGLPSDDVRAVALDAEGAVWAGTFSGAARRAVDGQWTAYVAPGESPDTARYWNQVSAVAVGPRGALWLGSTAGVAMLR